MNRDQKDGVTILLVSITMILALLVVSDGWGIQGMPLVWFDSSEIGWLREYRHDTWQQTFMYRISQTRYIIAFLLFNCCYGVARYMSLLPPLQSLCANWLKKNLGPPSNDA